MPGKVRLGMNVGSELKCDDKHARRVNCMYVVYENNQGVRLWWEASNPVNKGRVLRWRATDWVQLSYCCAVIVRVETAL